MHRRHLLVSSLMASHQAWGQAPAKAMFDQLKIVIPGGKGGGWDQTGRTLGTAMQMSGVVKTLSYVNIGGQGGQLGLQEYRKHEADPNALMIGGMVMVGATSQVDARINMQGVQPLARLTTDYSILCVSSKSTIKDVDDLAGKLRTGIDRMRFAGGSKGGVDHMISIMMGMASKNKARAVNYTPFTSGQDVVTSLVNGDSEIGISGYSEFKGDIESQQIRPIATSNMSSQFGYPSLRKYGVDLDVGNWRGVFTGKAVAPAARSKLMAAVETAVNHEHWKTSLERNRWSGAWQSGKDFAEFVELQRMLAKSMAYMLKFGD